VHTKQTTQQQIEHHALTNTETPTFADKINDSESRRVVPTGYPLQLTHNFETEAMLNSPHDQKLNTDPVKSRGI